MRAYSIAFALVAAAHCAAAYPRVMGFDGFAFRDPGQAVTVDRLLRDGAVPTRDFAYYYGLSALGVNRGVFAVFGDDPRVVGWVHLVGSAAVAAGVLRVVLLLRLGRLARVFMLLALGVILNVWLTPSPVHVYEPALLVHALAERVRGRPAVALTLATLAVTVKPSLGYVVGLLLLIDVLLATPATGFRRWRPVAAAAVVGLTVLGGLAAWCGVEAVARTLVPLDARTIYRADGFGFFTGSGRQFWLPDRPTLAHYLATPAGVWLLATAGIVVALPVAAARLRSDPAARFVVTAGLAHLIFVGVFFGNRWSYIYYAFLPFLALAVVIDRLPVWLPAGRRPARVVGIAVGVCGCVLVSINLLAQHLREGVRMWRGSAPSDVTAGLYAEPSAVREWQAVRDLAATRRVFVLTRLGCELIPGARVPRSWFLHPAIARSPELDAARREIAAADYLIVPNWDDHLLLTCPAFAAEVRAFRWVRDNGAFTLYERVTE